ncbi:hypothetical protein A3D85_02530 [Candidatus Amesbacteria bacterium RIFCSPHIGHO2_02_FULL_47_9]|uniref:Glycoside hydrolase family 42 N-terminal domain-containing protein n=1 Tax=Candidatus Amesbacteria bacterium RIFCSPHIGHO2_01_FULL_48_32b TaxID=1797253 RepID=A0A1F4YDD0_9BACT|nr:MAG: hypothetical protein A2876_03295 [Candidatus Amesbacteria bacterium RIFCSPHIGHO2_01_FULL_48_32b]OGD02342.1 MAG: hypothetical protein A3D85_02530 [Candidatus Amesbacteria bacterium RIFCSPHIGHO2_02_FULL_47_9]OGD08477.1 MAG: hypothetical protein A2899_01635 [Candidatus Amesbacteria bacterium RIFCSPLOWO2_01_FULL_49_25]
MIRIVTLFLFLFIISPAVVSAADRNFVTLVIPVRGREYWRQSKDISQLEFIKTAVESSRHPSTWLIQYDALTDNQIVSSLNSISSAIELGLFLEVTRNLALDSFVNYPWETEKWERADKIFLSGYSPQDRFKLIDTAFNRFKNKFGFYPASVGSWYIDSRSLAYIHDQYHVQAVLGVSDQYLTDGYQLWGQYVGEPYYPSLNSSLEPASDPRNKIDIVKVQWASREPLLSYGAGVKFSNFSVQVNDYARYHNLDQKYLDRLIRIYTTDLTIPLAQITLGVEVGELEEKFLPQFKDQLQAVSRLGLQAVTMSKFASEYQKIYPDTSPSMTITSAIDNRAITWYQSPLYRSAVLTENGQSRLVDLRYYHSSRFYDNDWTQADSRQNLYRVVPAVIDQIGLGNYQPADFPISPPPPIHDYLPVKISSIDKLKQALYKLVPDIRTSKLNGRWIIGLTVSPEKLCLMKCTTFRYPTLEAFLGLRRFLRPDMKIYAAWQDTLPNPLPGELVIKNSLYGIENLATELSMPKLFENSLYQISR